MYHAYQNVSVAAIQMGVDQNILLQACRGFITFAYNFKWMFVDDDAPIGKLVLVYRIF